MGYLILGAVLAGAIAALVLALRSRQKAIQRAKVARDKYEKLSQLMAKLREAYRDEAKRMEAMATGSESERFNASLRILRDLSTDG